MGRLSVRRTWLVRVFHAADNTCAASASSSQLDIDCGLLQLARRGAGQCNDDLKIHRMRDLIDLAELVFSEENCHRGVLFCKLQLNAAQIQFASGAVPRSIASTKPGSLF